MKKRIFDILFSLAGLIILSPLFVLLSALVKAGSGGKVIFSQIRIGRDFKPFRLYKFRTMFVGAEGLGHGITVGGDARITPVGRVMRRFKLDDLPQLFNVLKGDMSLVGPRPEARKYVSMFRDDFKKILGVRPGMTDMASFIYGNEESVFEEKKDPEDYYASVILPEKIKLGKRYVRKSGILYDLKLMVLTIFKVAYPGDFIARRIESLSPHRRKLVILIEAAIFLASNYLAFLIRYDGVIAPDKFSIFFALIPFVVAIRIALMFAFSIDRGLWRYVSAIDLVRISGFVLTGTILIYGLVCAAFGRTYYPRSIYFLDAFLNIFFLTSVRLFRKFHDISPLAKTPKARVIVIGAASTAEMFLRDIDNNPNYTFTVIGCIDSDPLKKGLRIRNTLILGAMKDMRDIVEREEPDEFVIAIEPSSTDKIREITRRLREFDLPIKTVPNLWGIITGRDSATKTKIMEPEDVLFREPVSENVEGMTNMFAGKRVLVTGAGGSIGSELSAQIAAIGPKELILLERHEESLYKIDMALRNRYPKTAVTAVIADVTNEKRIRDVMMKHRPEVVFHCAAYKHVPLMEIHAAEAFRTNVVGTRLLCAAAGESGVGRFVLISTDKAVNPASVMGKTKMIAEGVVHSFAKDPFDACKYMIVRFGNVLGSSGSVVPLFEDQIRRGGPVTVTHPDMTRYFMTIPEASQLVLQAACLGVGGELYVLDMGQPVKILDLAKKMIALYGLKLGVDIHIVFTGLRPGEKLYEELFSGNETMEATTNPKINRVMSGAEDGGNFLDALETIGVARDSVFNQIFSEIQESLAAVPERLSNDNSWRSDIA